MEIGSEEDLGAQFSILLMLLEGSLVLQKFTRNAIRVREYSSFRTSASELLARRLR
jgi:hypothetical protein